MSTTLRETIARMPRDRQAEIAAETARLRSEVLTLRDLRKARELTRVQPAETLGQDQVPIGRLERRSDLLLSTFQRYAEALSGTLGLVVQFPDRPPVRLGAPGELDGDAEPTPHVPGRAAAATYRLSTIDCSWLRKHRFCKTNPIVLNTLPWRQNPAIRASARDRGSRGRPRRRLWSGRPGAAKEKGPALVAPGLP